MPKAPEPIHGCDIYLDRTAYPDHATLALRKRGTSIDMVLVHLSVEIPGKSPFLYLDSFFYNFEVGISKEEYRTAVSGLQDTFTTKYGTIKTLAGAAMEWVALVAIWMGCKNVKLEDAWKSAKSDYTSFDLSYGAKHMLYPSLASEIEKRIKKKAEVHKQDEQELAKKFYRAGYYGMWNFVPERSRGKGKFVSFEDSLHKTSDRVATAQSILDAQVRSSFLDLSVAPI
jgi:hypothetical protein